MKRTNANVAATVKVVLAWFLVLLGTLGIIGAVSTRTFDFGTVFWLLVFCGAVGYLLQLRRRAAAAAKAAIAARADEQNERYLKGDPGGVFGEFQPGRVD